MFNNFTQESSYSCCDVIVQQEDEGRGALLIGDFNSATDEAVIARHKIKTIITTAAGLDHLEIPPNVTHIVYPLKDAKSENIQVYFNQSFTTIDRKLNQGGVLVHCAAGVSRSATIVIAYLMRKNQIGFKSAINLVRAKRKGICPNLGFQLQLKKFQTELASKREKISHTQNVKKVERVSEDRNHKQEERKIENNSFFQFEIKTSNNSSVQINRKKPQVKKGIPSKMLGFTRPKQKQLVEVQESNLFISGKAAKRPGSQAGEASQKYQKAKKNPMLGTWGPMGHNYKQF